MSGINFFKSIYFLNGYEFFSGCLMVCIKFFSFNILFIDSAQFSESVNKKHIILHMKNVEKNKLY